MIIFPVRYYFLAILVALLRGIEEIPSVDSAITGCNELNKDAVIQGLQRYDPNYHYAWVPALSWIPAQALAHTMGCAVFVLKDSRIALFVLYVYTIHAVRKLSPEEMKVVLENILRMMKGEVCFNNLNEMQEHILEFASNYVKAVENRKMNAKEIGKAIKLTEELTAWILTKEFTPDQGLTVILFVEILFSFTIRNARRPKFDSEIFSEIDPTLLWQMAFKISDLIALVSLHVCPDKYLIYASYSCIEFMRIAMNNKYSPKFDAKIVHVHYDANVPINELNNAESFDQQRNAMVHRIDAFASDKLNDCYNEVCLKTILTNLESLKTIDPRDFMYWTVVTKYNSYTGVRRFTTGLSSFENENSMERATILLMGRMYAGIPSTLEAMDLIHVVTKFYVYRLEWIRSFYERYNQDLITLYAKVPPPPHMTTFAVKFLTATLKTLSVEATAWREKHVSYQRTDFMIARNSYFDLMEVMKFIVGFAKLFHDQDHAQLKTLIESFEAYYPHCNWDRTECNKETMKKLLNEIAPILFFK